MGRVKYIIPDSVKSVIFTKSESRTSQRLTCLIYKFDFGANGNLKPLKKFQSSLLEGNNRGATCQKKWWTYNNSNIEELHVCTVKLRHKDKVARCRFFVVQGDGSVLLGMLDIEV